MKGIFIAILAFSCFLTINCDVVKVNQTCFYECILNGSSESCCDDMCRIRNELTLGEAICIIIRDPYLLQTALEETFTRIANKLISYVSEVPSLIFVFTDIENGYYENALQRLFTLIDNGHPELYEIMVEDNK